MKQTPLADILRKIRPLALHHQAAFLRSHIAVESGGNIHRTSVRIRELQAALHDVTMRRLKRERAA
jgi:hypothetical protein